MKEKINKSIWGICMILLGLGIAGNAFGFWNFTIFFDGWWTLFIIIPCAASLLSDGFAKGALSGLVVGILLLLAGRGVITYSFFWKMLIPVLLIVVGIQMFFRSFTKSENSVNKQRGPVSYILSFGLLILILGGIVSTVSVYGNSNNKERINFNQVFTGVEALSVDVSDVPVSIVTGDQFMVTAKNVAGDFEASMSGNTLVVEKGGWNFFFTGMFQDEEEDEKAEIIITIPEAIQLREVELDYGSEVFQVENIKAAELIIDGGSGTASFNNIIATEKAAINTGSGSVVIENAKLSNADFDTGSGAVSFEGKITGKCNIDTGSGNTVFALTGNKEDYEIIGEGGSGYLWIDGEKHNDYKFKTEQAKYTLKLDGGSGRFVVDFKQE